MKKLTYCPHCQSPLIQKTIPEHLNCLKYENCSARCVVDYSQYFERDYNDDVKYVSLGTPNKKFNMYWYTNHTSYPVKLIHVYSNAELNIKGVAYPCIIINNFELDLNDLTKMQDKFDQYIAFQ